MIPNHAPLLIAEQSGMPNGDYRAQGPRSALGWVKITGRLWQ